MNELMLPIHDSPTTIKELDIQEVADNISELVEMYATADGKILWVYNAQTHTWVKYEGNAQPALRKLVAKMATNAGVGMGHKTAVRNKLTRQCNQIADIIMDNLRESAGSAPFNNLNSARYDYMMRQACFQNGVVEQDGSFRELAQSDYCITPIPHDYKQGNCDTWHEILDFLVADKEFLMQWLGSCAFPSKFNKGTICHLQASSTVKDGSNGKSTLMELLVPILFAPEQQMKIDNRNAFSSKNKDWSRLEGVLYAYVDEIKSSDVEGSFLKDRVNAKYAIQETKNVNPVPVHSGVHFMTTANGQLRINDDSEGLYRRVHFCVMRQHLADGSEGQEWLNDFMQNRLHELHEQAGAFWYECVQMFVKMDDWAQCEEAQALRGEFASNRSEASTVLNDGEWFIQDDNAVLPQVLVIDIMRRANPRLKKSECIDAFRNIRYKDGTLQNTPTWASNYVEAYRTNQSVYVKGYRLGNAETLTTSEFGELCKLYKERMKRNLGEVAVDEVF